MSHCNLMDLANSNKFNSLNKDRASSALAEFASIYSLPENGSLFFHVAGHLKSKTGWRLRGVPIMGFAAQVYVNGSLNGTIANYAVSSKLIRHQAHYPPRD